MRTYVDPEQQALGVLVLGLRDERARLHLHRFDGTGPAVDEVDPLQLDSPFEPALHASLVTSDEALLFVRESSPGHRYGEDLVLAQTERSLARLDSMRAVIWDRDRFVVIYGMPVASKTWAVTTQLIDCSD